MRDALGITKKNWARHWGLNTDKDRILAIGRHLGEGLMKTLSREIRLEVGDVTMLGEVFSIEFRWRGI